MKAAGSSVSVSAVLWQAEKGGKPTVPIPDPVLEIVPPVCDDDGENVVEHLPGVEDFEVAMATYCAACQRWPNAAITCGREPVSSRTADNDGENYPTAGDESDDCGHGSATCHVPPGVM